ACGNCFLLKPSEQTPMTSARIFALLERIGLPPGVVQLVQGGKAAVDAILEHPQVSAVSFVGSTAVAREVYARATAHGKRAQCQGGAKNPVIVLPDADLDMTTQIVADSAFGCAGQRCLAASLAITVGEAKGSFGASIAEAAASRRVGYGADDATQMGPVISQASRTRIEGHIARGCDEGAALRVDGRGRKVAGHDGGYFLHPTVLEGVPPGSEIARTEVFGPVLSLLHADSLDAAIGMIN